MRILVVDDERISRATTIRQLNDVGFSAQAADNAFVALECLEESDWDVVITDLRMPTMSGMDLLSQVRESYPGIDVLVMTAFGSVESAVDALHQGAADYLTKPFPFGELHARLERLREIRTIRAQLASLRQAVGSESGFHGIVGRCREMREVYERITRFARHVAPVLVNGETGTGKDLVARALHAEGDREHGRFITVACGTIPRELAESELFGHERGSFTGASKRRLGHFEQANGGTLLLDDVDDLPLDLQVKLLRVLQDGAFTRVGGDSDVKVDVRVVATTKVDLRAATAEGRFRDDLYYRLRGLEIRLPPLRERGDDVLLLARHFLQVSGGEQAPRLSPQTAEVLRHHNWPGNARELQRAMEAAAIICDSGRIEPGHLPFDLRQVGPMAGPERLFQLHMEGRDEVDFQRVVREFEDELIDWSLRRSGGQQAPAAALLRLPRTTLQSKLAKRVR